MTLIIFAKVKYLLHLAYNGTNYHGWQRQKNTSDTIQEIIEAKLSILLQQKISLLGCGRTDKGVHASQYFAHFTAIVVTDNLVYKLNRLLPNDIVVYDLVSVPEKFNARFDAKKRSYRYYFHLNKNSFIKDLSTLVHLDSYDLKSMLQAINLIPKYHDFGAFCKAPDKLEHTKCSIFSVALYSDEKQKRFCFEIEANRFLRGMIRILMHRLLDVLNKKMTVDEFEQFLNSSRSKTAVQFAYPQGLFLHRISYDSIELSVHNELESFLFKGLQKL